MYDILQKNTEKQGILHDAYVLRKEPFAKQTKQDIINM